MDETLLNISLALGATIRRLRETQDAPLWKVAAAAEMDSTQLSKIERGQRLPTPQQTAALARYFAIEPNELESLRMAAKFAQQNGHNPAAASLAIARIHETAGPGFVNTKRTTVNYRPKAVQKSKNKG